MKALSPVSSSITPDSEDRSARVGCCTTQYAIVQQTDSRWKVAIEPSEEANLHARAGDIVLELQVAHPLSAAFTAATISLTVIIVDPSASPATHDEMGALPRAMFTSVTSSLIVTSPLPSQSPLQPPTGVETGEGVAVAVGSSVGEDVAEGVGDGLVRRR